MWPNPQFFAVLVTFTEETLNGKLHFLCSDIINGALHYQRWFTLLTMDYIINEA